VLVLVLLVVVLPATASGAATRKPFRLDSYRGLGTWVDVYDWSLTHSGGAPRVGPEEIAKLPERGVRTVYLQTVGSRGGPDLVLEPDRIRALIDRAHAAGLSVVAWYAPAFVDVDLDLARLLAAASLPVDGLAVDIESTQVASPAERTRRLLELDARLDAALPGEVLGAITYPPIALSTYHPEVWPGFPWRDLAAHYDVFLPMNYWTYRPAGSPAHNGETYTADNVRALRSLLENPVAPVHPIGGIANGIGVADAEGMVRAARDTCAIGGSLYDLRTTAPGLWSPLQGLTATALPSTTTDSVVAIGGARPLGSTGDVRLAAPLAGIAATSTGDGYWLVAADGGIFSFGDATFRGSMGGIRLNRPVVGIAPTPTGHGYWLVAADGGIFSFGDATFYGSMGGSPLPHPAVGLTSTRDGGYVVATRDGAVRGFGPAAGLPGLGHTCLSGPVTGVAATPATTGVWLSTTGRLS
jgi:hypothetical protein